MIVTHVFFRVSSDHRSDAIAALKKEVETVRAMEGCIAFVPFIDPTCDQNVGVLHEWVSQQEFDAYLASESFASLGQTLRPLSISPPVSRRFDATLMSD
jgi:quinol monooxygenase YgiN